MQLKSSSSGSSKSHPMKWLIESPPPFQAGPRWISVVGDWRCVGEPGQANEMSSVVEFTFLMRLPTIEAPWEDLPLLNGRQPAF